jgi:hypothetical protein
MREYLLNEYGYSLDTIPISLGGTFNPVISGNIRYQICLSRVTNNQSICYPYYTIDNQTMRRKSPNNNDAHHRIKEKSVISSTKTSMPSPSSLFALFPLRRSSDSPAEIRLRKRESSSSTDFDKRQRSNESLIEEEESPVNILREETINE